MHGIMIRILQIKNDDPVNVTFRVNSSTVDGVVDSTSGVDLRGTVTQWGPGSNMVSDGGDYWSLTVALNLETMNINMEPKSKTKMELLVIIGKMIFLELAMLEVIGL